MANDCYQLAVDVSQNKIYCFTQKNVLLSFNGPFLDYLTFEHSCYKKNDSLMVIYNDSILAVTENNFVHFWNVNSLKKEKTISLYSRPLCLLASDQKLFISIEKGEDNEGCVMIYQMETGLFEKIVAKNEQISTIIFDKNNPELLICGCVSGNIFYIDHNNKIIQNSFIFNEEEKPAEPSASFIFNLKKNKNNISAMTSDQNLMIVGHNSGLLKMFNSKNFSFICNLKSHKDIIEEVIIFKNDEDFISISHDKTCIIWSIGDKVPIKIINMNQNISSVYLSDLQNEIIISTQNGDIFFRNLPSYELLLELNYKSSLNQQFIVDSKENFLFVSNDTGIYKTKNPISKTHLKVCGKNINIPEIYNFITKETKLPKKNLD